MHWQCMLNEQKNENYAKRNCSVILRLSIKDRQKRAMSASPTESILVKGGYLKTTFVCKFCPSEPGLHPGLCFEEYHTKIDFYVLYRVYRYYEIYCAIILRKLCLGKLGLFSKYEVSTSGNNQCSDHYVVCVQPLHININYYWYYYYYYYYTNCLSTSLIVTPTVVLRYSRTYVMFTSNRKFSRNLFLSQMELSDLLSKMKNATLNVAHLGRRSKSSLFNNVLKINDFGKPDKAGCRYSTTLRIWYNAIIRQ